MFVFLSVFFRAWLEREREREEVATMDHELKTGKPLERGLRFNNPYSKDFT
jgi:hypothetical protein